MAAIEKNIQIWDKGIIPFLISSDFKPGSNEYQQIALAINEFNQKTNIRFIQRTTEFDYIVFRSGQSGWCSSQVGRQGGEQSITCHLAGRQFSAGNLIHEIMHMLGFHHEHQRADRDNFVSINFANVKRSFDFDKIYGENLTEYDYGSVMHYPRVITNTNLVHDPQKDTIIPTKPLDIETIIGQRGRLSQKDIMGINKLYLTKYETKINNVPLNSSKFKIIVCILLIITVVIKRTIKN